MTGPALPVYTSNACTADLWRPLEKQEPDRCRFGWPQNPGKKPYKAGNLTKLNSQIYKPDVTLLSGMDWVHTETICYLMSKRLPEFHKRVKQTLDSHFSPQLWHIQTGTSTLNHSPCSGSPTGILHCTCAWQWLTSRQRFIKLILLLSNLLVSFCLSVSYPPTTEIIILWIYLPNIFSWNYFSVS